MTRPYIAQDVIDAIRNARGFGVPWEVISIKLGLSVEECRAAIGMPSLRPVPDETEREAGPDLFKK